MLRKDDPVASPTGAAVTTLGALYGEARRRLEAAALADAALDARLLVEHFTGTGRIDALTHPDRVIASETACRVYEALERRLAGEPVHRIVGWREFYGLKLGLSPDTLEPRPDTETLVDLALPYLQKLVRRRGSGHILDLGTGTGAIALALLTQIPELTALASDISPGALEKARENADLLGAGPRFAGRISDWFAGISGRFDMIVSNPPYIATSTMAMLSPEVRLYDPARALDGGRDGLEPYRAIATGALAHLEEGGYIAVEVGFDQREAVTAIFERSKFRLEKAAKDLAGNDRALIFQG